MLTFLITVIVFTAFLFGLYYFIKPKPIPKAPNTPPLKRPYTKYDEECIFCGWRGCCLRNTPYHSFENFMEERNKASTKRILEETKET